MKNMISIRALIIVAFVFLIFVALAVKLFSIQILNNEYYKYKADLQQKKPQVVKAERGIIKDTNGEVLSFTANNVSFFVDTRMMTQEKVDSIAKIFSKVMGKSKSYYKELIEDGIRNVCIERKVPMDKALYLKKFVIDGLFYEEDHTRVYPYGRLASHVIGFVNRDFVGVEGIERAYNKNLSGIDGYYVFQRDVKGRIISLDEKNSRPSQSGNNIILTINRIYQKILEEELLKGLQKYEGESAVGIIMNPNTGEILALANMPDYDPANYDNFSDEARKNRAITDTYEPGSTIKPIILSILFDQNLVKEDEVINTENGKFIFKNAKISDTHPHESLTVRQILEQSSNVGMAKLSFRISDELLYKRLRDFGFSNSTSIELPGEADGKLKNPINFSPLTKIFMSFGYELSVTPLQMITAYSALINGGILLKPYIVKAVVDSQGNLIEDKKPTKIRNVISKETSDKIRNLMIGVVERGTGIAAQLDNVLVGGKTGTSQKLENGNYTNSKHNSSFIGFFPADNPQIICMILINSPKVGKYGGLVAAPIFHDVAKRILETDLNIVPNRKKIERSKILIDQLITNIKSSSSTSKSYLNVSENFTNNYKQRRFSNINRKIMPNLLNQSLRVAIALLNEIELKYKIVGTGKVVFQSIEPGAPITSDSVCLIRCASSNFVDKSTPVDKSKK